MLNQFLCSPEKSIQRELYFGRLISKDYSQTLNSQTDSVVTMVLLDIRVNNLADPPFKQVLHKHIPLAHATLMLLKHRLSVCSSVVLWSCINKY